MEQEERATKGRKEGGPTAFGLFTFGLGNYTPTSATNKKVNGAKSGLDSREIKALSGVGRAAHIFRNTSIIAEN